MALHEQRGLQWWYASYRINKVRDEKLIIKVGAWYYQAHALLWMLFRDAFLRFIQL